MRNTGGAALTIPTVTTIGANAGDFIVATAGMTTPVSPGGSTSFTVAFAPTGNTSGPRTATLRIANDDPDENPFDISLTGMAFSTTADADGDGLNDWTEYQQRGAGFDWQKPQPELVKAFLAGSNASGLYTPTQVQAMNVDTPVIQKDPTTGEFTVTIGLEKSTDLVHYTPFPVTMPQAAITADGKLQLRFSVPDNTAFFRLETK